MIVKACPDNCTFDWADFHAKLDIALAHSIEESIGVPSQLTVLNFAHYSKAKKDEQDKKVDRDLEAVAMNIVHQIGDALYEALPKDVAHDHFVDARQATNDIAIEFAKKLIKKHTSEVTNGSK